MARYLVTLNPLGSFFFGGERTLGMDGDENNIVRSMEFPQQTTILGMLRKELLIFAGIYKDDIFAYKGEEVKKKDKLIGKDGFKFQEDKELSFGSIKSISPVFIKFKDEILINTPMDHHQKEEDPKKEEEIKYEPLTFGLACTCNYGEGDIEKKVFLPSNFDNKKGINHDFINSKGEIIKKSNIFTEENNIGIQIDKQKGTSEDKKLFRITRYKLNNAKFIFVTEIDEDMDIIKNCKKKLEEYSNIVNLGGEGSYFKISFEKYEEDIVDDFKGIVKNKGPYKKVVLLSDTFLTNDEYKDYVEYSIADTKSFKYLTLKNKSDLDKNNEKRYYKHFEKSLDKYTFLARGSVLFTTNLQKLIKCIDKKFLKDIGYNTCLGGIAVENVNFYKITCLTNMHVGDGEATYNIIDNQVQRDVITGYPTINASSLKGSLRSFFNVKIGQDNVKKIFGSEEKMGDYKILAANLLSLPVRSNNHQFYRATSPKAINDFINMLESFNFEDTILNELRKLTNITEDKGGYIFVGAGNENNLQKSNDKDLKERQVTIEGFDLKLEEKKYNNTVSKIFGQDLIVINDTVFGEIAEELPVIARNKLNNGESESLWYEQVVPRETSFYFAVVKGNDATINEEFDKKFNKNLVQIGGNSTIGYGFCKIEKIDEVKKNEQKKG